MSHEGAARFIIFQCRTNDRASYVLSYGQPLASNCISSSETVAKREYRLPSKNAHRPNYCSWLAVCVSAISIFTAKSHIYR